MTVPGSYIDLQVNGYAGVDFNGDGEFALNEMSLQRACEAMRRDGVSAILATVITDHMDAMDRRLRRLIAMREAVPESRDLIRGVHIEGPFINESAGYRGAHPIDAICPAQLDQMQRLLDAAGGLAKIVTLAPERDPGLRVTNMLARQGIVVAAGHCNPTPDELDAAIDAGLGMWTHLGNGCPMQLHRHDNVIQRALSRSGRLWLCFIADGVHVPFYALGNYLKLAGDRAIVVSDAMAAAGLGPGKHRIARWEIEVGEDLAAWAPDRSHLVGSAMTMAQAHTNLKNHLALDETCCHKLLWSNPATVINIRDI